MNKEEFEKLFKTAKTDGYVVITLSNTGICADNYSLEYGDKSISVYLYWKGFKIGYCKLSKVKGVF